MSAGVCARVLRALSCVVREPHAQAIGTLSLGDSRAAVWRHPSVASRSRDFERAQPANSHKNQSVHATTAATNNPPPA